jgi:hypothetical protein
MEKVMALDWKIPSCIKGYQLPKLKNEQAALPSGI